jgi:cytosolic nonspecific dipeptidase
MVYGKSRWESEEAFPMDEQSSRGICYFFIDVECSTKDLHSGCFGGTMSVIDAILSVIVDQTFSLAFSHEAMTDLVAVMSTLVDDQGRILIDGIYDDVTPLLPEEAELYKRITFDTVRIAALLESDLLLFYGFSSS